jgi:hypothetical protein
VPKQKPNQFEFAAVSEPDHRLPTSSG